MPNRPHSEQVESTRGSMFMPRSRSSWDRRFVRVPGWCEGATAEVNGEALPTAETAPGQYATLNRTWRVGDTVTLTLVRGGELMQVDVELGERPVQP